MNVYLLMLGDSIVVSVVAGLILGGAKVMDIDGICKSKWQLHYSVVYVYMTRWCHW